MHGAADQKFPGFHSFKKKQPHEVARDVETPVVDIDEDRMTRSRVGGGNESNEKVDIYGDLPATNSSSHLKMDAWKTIVSFWGLGLFSGAKY